LTSRSLLHIVVHRVELAQPAAVVARLGEHLDVDERASARRRVDGARWTVARAALRSVLGEALDQAPAALTFATGPHGKPELPGSPLRFNLSHSGDRALIALAHEVEVGVDVERTNRRSTAVERSLTEGERAGLPDDADRHVELLRIWCRKEALAKAIGGGLGWAPEDFDTSAPAGHTLRDLEPGDGYVGALAVAAGAFTLSVEEWSA
jgi:4'-phosphopantetheinyl transferase